MKRTLLQDIVLLVSASFVSASLCAAQPTAKTLDIYYIDVEGGQATLFVSPSGETVLVDTGFPGARDPKRIMDAINAAGAKQIDYLLITHYHGDHIGGFQELAKLVPVMHYVDHGITVQPEQNYPSKQAYDAASAKGSHIIAKPGDKLPIKGIDWTIVSAAGKTLKGNMSDVPGAGKPNAYCADFVGKDIQVDLENAQSTGSVIRYGKFRTVDLGDLLWNVEAELACPVNRIGTIDVLLTTHHGMSWSGPKALVYALAPRVVVMNNGIRKGAQVETYETLESAPGLENLWQLHWSVNGLLEHNVPSRFIANVEDPALIASLITNPPAPATSLTGPKPANSPPPSPPPPIGNPDHDPAYWIKVSAQADGTFTVTNARNGFSKTYQRINR
jgi:beta-lactamase superfamily II metal-dependent hydrolase